MNAPRPAPPSPATANVCLTASVSRNLNTWAGAPDTMDAVMPALRTSSGSPIRVDFLASKLLSVTGKLGLTIAPGKKDPSGGWNRDLTTDLARLADHYRTRVLVSLMEPHEYMRLGIVDLAECAKPLGIKVIHFPIRDVQSPSKTRMKEFAALITGLRRSLERGDTVVVHCRGGLGRSGTVAACVLVASGHSPEEAIALTRKARPGAIEVSAQEDWIALYARQVAREHPARADRRPAKVTAATRSPDGHAGARSAPQRHLPVVNLNAPPRQHRPARTDPPLDRVLGCLLGGALGDALGYPVEFEGPGTALIKKYGADAPTALTYAGGTVARVSDDTQMTLFVAEGLIRAHQRFIDRGLCSVVHVTTRALMRWYSTQSRPTPKGPPADGWLVLEPGLHARRAPGNTIMQELALRADGEGDDDQVVARNTSKGCGAVMRAAPFGLAFKPPQRTFESAVEDGRVTHGHPSGYLASGYLATTVGVLARGGTLRRAMAVSDEALRQHTGHEELAAALAGARGIAERRIPTPADLESLGGGWTGEEALAIALACVLRHDDRTPRAVERTLWRAACHGGDSDSTAAIAGNVLGTMVGAKALPASWLRQLELRDAIERIGRDLHASIYENAVHDTVDYPPN